MHCFFYQKTLKIQRVFSFFVIIALYKNVLPLFNNFESSSHKDAWYQFLLDYAQWLRVEVKNMKSLQINGLTDKTG